MRNYAETCKGICGYDLMYNSFRIPFAIKTFSFCGVVFKRILAWEGGTSKTFYWMSLFKQNEFFLLSEFFF